MRAFYVGVSLDIFLDVAVDLRGEHDIDPVYWSTTSKFEEKIVQKFPNVCFHDVISAAHGFPPKCISLNNGYRKLGEDILEEYATTQNVLMEMMMTRADPGGGFSYYEFSHYFHQYLASGLELIEKLQPDVWISVASPHLMYDYVLYEIFQKNNITCIILTDTVVPGRLYIVDKLKDASRTIKKEYLQLQKDGEDVKNVPKDILEYLRKVRGNYEDGVPYTSVMHYKETEQNYFSEAEARKRINSELHSLKKKIRQYTYSEIFRKKTQAPLHYYKEQDVRWEMSFLSRQSYDKVRLNLLINRRRLIDKYDSYSKVPDLDEKFVYIPLHWQPESTSVPDGGRLSDQLFLVKLLHASLPEGVKVYVKECPAQFEWHRGSFARPDWYYDELARLPNVTLIKLDISTYTLIDYSLCVLTLTGTAGFEALCRGKPVLLGGDVIWYKDAPGVYRVKSAIDMKRAIESILVDTSVDARQFELFLTAFGQSTFRCVAYQNKLDYLSFDKEENKRELIRAVLSRTSAVP